MNLDINFKTTEEDWNQMPPKEDEFNGFSETLVNLLTSN